jgi:transposase
LLKWATAELTPQDIILLEAGSNSFEVCKRLGNLGLRACVRESCHVGKHAKTYADNDKMAAARIAPVYLAGNAPCVWVPDEQSQERRELLHAYRKAVTEHTAATNSIKGYLNGHGIRLGKHSRPPERSQYSSRPMGVEALCPQRQPQCGGGRCRPQAAGPGLAHAPRQPAHGHGN